MISLKVILLVLLVSTCCQTPTKLQNEELDNDEPDPSVMITMIKELMHDVLMDVRLDFTDEGIELV